MENEQSKEINLFVSEIEFRGLDAIVYIVDKHQEEDLVNYYLEDFVPTDYNVRERIVGGYESPDYEKNLDEDCTVEDWWSEIDDSYKISMITEHLIKLKPFFKSGSNEFKYLKKNINIHLTN